MATAHPVTGALVQQPGANPPPKGQGHRQRFAGPIPSTTPGQHHRHDLFYGQEALSRICHRFITFLFTCPDHPPTPLAANNAQRLKARFPTAKGSSGHRLFISAIMIASKVICDDTYSNKSWSFKDKVSQDFSSDKPPNQFPKYDVAMVSKRSARVQSSQSATPLPDPSTTTSAIPNFGSRNSTPSKPQSQSRSSSYDSPTTPDTPSPSFSNSTSPTTSPEPLTPPSTDDCNARIHGQDQSPRFSCVPEMSTTHPLKMKMFAQAVGTTW
ncbi:hypothetical protein BDN72DRAFT_119629 [Pluteus cervinus]|uniref:Uncharacterized protein n=1 Tax=Pluteus cervinus TaxID=181527 RepID=A0ACD3B833_9AGAR|nr:hypothetical protein BDN72DRAFT_119629 [Pluteus cervinus]